MNTLDKARQLAILAIEAYANVANGAGQITWLQDANRCINTLRAHVKLKTVTEVEGKLNIGHGHVYTRPDGFRARCGGPKICEACAKDAIRLQYS